VTDQGNIVIVLSHGSLLGLRLVDPMVRLPQQRVKPPAFSSSTVEWAG
jgi:hypothetical protein